ncbi:MAG TPA: hypothetical protein VFU11_13705, partial [Solirubrobacterales bacterium]|nr:hypothetical protein [Solirubrobacterales bacterium]
MPETELERLEELASAEAQPLAALLAADVVAVHLGPSDEEPALELSILDEAAGEEVRSQCVDLRSFLRERLGSLDREERDTVLEL